ncbi:hypothetical protein NC653_031027 [Populus alba x Populus x berolinensis]|uniref:Uncharacterized protein n=1 Tax=Populus alba x Populus x berolinensis TaxID=444605 RepID=A0AAD6LYK2_9ROSI|nr:hypothetical protein NC653_031027 [Populus alba x Populus x berolinensis]
MLMDWTHPVTHVPNKQSIRNWRYGALELKTGVEIQGKKRTKIQEKEKRKFDRPLGGWCPS